MPSALRLSDFAEGRCGQGFRIEVGRFQFNDSFVAMPPHGDRPRFLGFLGIVERHATALPTHADASATVEIVHG